MSSPYCVIFQSPHTKSSEMPWLEIVSVYELRVLEYRRPGSLNSSICLGFLKIKIRVCSAQRGAHICDHSNIEAESGRSMSERPDSKPSQIK